MTQPTYSLVHISHVVDKCSLADLSLLTIELKQEVHLYSKQEFDTAVSHIARRIIFYDHLPGPGINATNH